MISKIKNKITILVSAVLLSVSILVPATVAYAGPPAAGCDNTITHGISQGVNDSVNGANVNCQPSTAGGSSITKIAKQVIFIFSIVVGAISVIMIIYGGFRYITSGGDSGNVGNAKNTLIYAVVGLIIVALAQLIVQFVLSTSSEVQTKSTSDGTSGYISRPKTEG